MRSFSFGFPLLLMLLSFNLNAQTIEGVVVDANEHPLENVYVYNHTSKTHAHTSVTGRFILEQSKIGDSVTVSLLGYKIIARVLTRDDIDKGAYFVLESKSVSLEEMVISQQIDPLSTITRMDLETNPVNSSQEILRKVPGLIIGQHAGGGKAEQIFLRGFDIDHGTDINLSVDGMPVNMVSHAHGQGYSDLHFIIPETIENINFGKGPYYANRGDFATAGYVAFKTKDNLETSEIRFTYGQFNTLRTLGLFNLTDKGTDESAYIAVEYLATDGPYVSPQNFNRLNLLGKYSTYIKDNDKLILNLSHFTSRWDASGQIPQRAVDQGVITRFGAIDDTEGGATSRTNANVHYVSFLNDDTQVNANAFFSHYDFELYSNFTFFLEDPINGDQIKQFESRDIFGFNSEINHEKNLGDVDANITGGAGLRHDIVNGNELSHTKNRKETLNYIQLGDVNQTNMFAYVNSDFSIGKFKVAPALRVDYFKFMYVDQLQEAYETLSEYKTVLSPKLNFFYTQNSNFQWFLKSGIGFHSNDTRVVVRQQGEDILPKAYGADLGAVWKPLPKMVFSTAVWYLFLEQEFVYVGDAGIVEPSGKSQRYGLDLGLRYQFTDWLYFDSDATFTHARSIDEPSEEDYIPLAPDFTLTGGLALNNIKNFSGGLRYRYIDDRPANEDNSIVAEGYFVTDINLNYDFGKVNVGIAIENLFDVDWNETQFATESRLQNEAQPVEEIHFTPGTPFFAKATVTYQF